jgi:hypothetical protein
VFLVGQGQQLVIAAATDASFFMVFLCGACAG